MSVEPVNCYDFPQYWDLSFRSETKPEADFLEDVFQKYSNQPVRRILEPGCGGGRMVLEMAARGYEVLGFDLSESAVKYVQNRLRRRGLSAHVFLGDMTDVCITPPVDAAYNMLNTFRHLTSETTARSHLECISNSLVTGGLFVLGFHLLPPDAELECREQWSARHGSTRVTGTLRVLSTDRRKRIEVIRFGLRVRNGAKDLKLRSDYQLRIYTARQVRNLLKSVPSLRLLDVYDFLYEIDEPLKLTDELGDAVFILQKQ
ncbi:MAG: class I SAM-dependent methyltransferase [Planctomycetota bacterium]|nr:class I SAM-dependent methyltransferase [Planctomycetota bacterium]